MLESPSAKMSDFSMKSAEATGAEATNRTVVDAYEMACHLHGHFTSPQAASRANMPTSLKRPSSKPQYPIGDLPYPVVVRDDADAAVLLPGVVGEQHDDVLALPGIQVGGGLIGEQDLGSLAGARPKDPPILAANSAPGLRSSAAPSPRSHKPAPDGAREAN